MELFNDLYIELLICRRKQSNLEDICNYYFISLQNALKGDLDKLQERLKHLAEKAEADLKSRLDRYKANLNIIEDDYKQELEKFKQELINDKTLQDIDKVL